MPQKSFKYYLATQIHLSRVSENLLMNYLEKHPKIIQFIFLLVIFFTICFLVSPSETNILWRLPSLFAGVPLAINNFAEYLMYDWMLVEIYDPELEDYEESALVKEITRSFSRSVLFCIEIIRDILLGGVKTIVAFTSWDFVGKPMGGLARVTLDFSCIRSYASWLCVKR